LPKLLLSHNGKKMEISAASSGKEGSSPYTYVLFQNVDSAGFDFRILPKSAQTVIDSALGLKKAALTGHSPLDKSLVIYTNDEEVLGALLSERVQQAILGWVTKNRNRIQDIRNHDKKLIFCVDGILSDTADLRQLIDGACLVYDALAESTNSD
jgi:hypothetical protein